MITELLRPRLRLAAERISRYFSTLNLRKYRRERMGYLRSARIFRWANCVFTG
jgi:hypothetical protein